MNVRDKLKVGPTSDRYEMPTAGSLDEPPFRPIYVRPALRQGDHPESLWDALVSQTADIVDSRSRAIILSLIIVIGILLSVAILVIHGDYASH